MLEDNKKFQYLLTLVHRNSEGNRTKEENLYDQMINKIISGFHKYRIWMYFEYYLQVSVTHLIFQRASGEMLPYTSPLNQKSNTLFFKKESIKSSIISSAYQFFFSALALSSSSFFSSGSS